jgi:hypothetical protein
MIRKYGLMSVEFILFSIGVLIKVLYVCVYVEFNESFVWVGDLFRTTKNHHL